MEAHASLRTPTPHLRGRRTQTRRYFPLCFCFCFCFSYFLPSPLPEACKANARRRRRGPRSPRVNRSGPCLRGTPLSLPYPCPFHVQEHQTGTRMQEHDATTRPPRDDHLGPGRNVSPSFFCLSHLYPQATQNTARMWEDDNDTATQPHATTTWARLEIQVCPPFFPLSP